MSIQTRNTGLQNEMIRLYCRMIKDGYFMNPIGQPIVEIIDTDGATVIQTMPAQMESPGIFFVDYFVPAHLPVSQYYDRWTFQWDANSPVTEQTMIFEIHSLNSYINFISTGLAVKTSNKAVQLLNDLNNDFIYEAQHIPIYNEQGMRIQQDNQKTRIKKYYYFTINDPYFNAESGDIYQVNNLQYVVFETLSIQSSSSDSSAFNSSISSGDSSSSSYSSISSESSTSSSSNTISSSSSSVHIVEDTSESNAYIFEQILTCVGYNTPPANGTLSKVSGNGSDSVTYSNYTVKKSSYSTIYNFAYKNWNSDFKPIVRLNTRIADDGWHTDYDGRIYFDKLMTPEDSPYLTYKFAYFSQEELLSFLKFGLDMMNSVPPASTAFSSIENAPGIWNPGILLYAAILALKRLVFGLNWKEKAIIFGTPEDARNAQEQFKALYADYQEMWATFAKNVKTSKLPQVGQISVPSYTLPGGRCLASTCDVLVSVDGLQHRTTLHELYNSFSRGYKIKILSMSKKDNSLDMAPIKKIWNSGYKDTFTLKTSLSEIRATKEHSFFIPDQNKYIPVIDIAKGTKLLINNNGSLVEDVLLENPIFYGTEEVFDMEVPENENFVANNIVTHNSRFFRYMYKSG